MSHVVPQMPSLSNHIDRRELLHRMGTGMGALGLATLLGERGALASEGGSARLSGNPLLLQPTHVPAKAKHIIHLFMNGGPSQVDTFDPKPLLTKHHGEKPASTEYKTERQTGGWLKSPFAFKKYGQSGLEISELYPEIAKHADDLCVIRSMHTNVPNHEPSLLMMTCGNTQPVRPSMGSWLLYGLGCENQNLPGFVVLCPGKPVVGPQLWSNSFLPGIYQGCHINNSKLEPTRVIDDIQNGSLTAGSQRRQLDLIQRLNAAHLEQRPSDPQLEARIQSMEMAFRMQTEAQEAFDVSKETKATQDLYGSGQYGQACLVARRLVERGVRIVQLFYGSGQPWDAHGDLENNHRGLAKGSDQAISALLFDLKRNGLLDETLVLWGGEFGRTPASEGVNGRDHNNHGFTVWLAGGGVKGGLAYGATDDFGHRSVENKVHVHDLHATMLYLMGINHEKLTYRYSGRDFRLTDVHGRIVHDIIA